ncbi:MAG: shikimate kinase, partial [Bradymonadaceae bacterium]
MTNTLQTFQNIFIMGHRGSGKSTVARLAGELLGLQVIDLDEVIEEREGRTCTEIIEESEPLFRDLERRYLGELVTEPTEEPRIISLGGGFHPVPTGGACIWIYRDGWQDVAAESRARLRPETDFQTEVNWMITEREPRWEQGAHLRLDVPRGRDPERTAEDLATLITWLLELATSPLARRTWVVAADQAQLERAVRDAKLFGFAGVEVRSDLVSASYAESLLTGGEAILASLRTPEPGWLASLHGAAAFDIDISLLDDVLATSTLGELDPRRIILSSHPASADPETVDRLIMAADELAEAHPQWSEYIALKWAPILGDYKELLDALRVYDHLCSSRRPV